MAIENYCGLAANGRRERRRAAPASISNLGDDLLVDILIRLPNPKSASRCKPVCKRWNSLISAPYFSRRFVSHHRILSAGKPPLLIHSGSQEYLISSFLPAPSDEIRTLVLDCFKDLLLLGVKKRPGDDESGRRFVVCNPFTKQRVTLPLAPPMCGTEYWRCTARLVCEPCNSITLDLGGGEEITHNPDYRFRVVRISEPEPEPNSGDLRVDVFCSNSVEWTKVVLDRHHHPAPLRWSTHLDNVVVSSNKKLYWTAMQGQIVGWKWNPFRPENAAAGSSPAFIDHPFELDLFASLSASQGTLYRSFMTPAIPEERLERNANVLNVWRLEKAAGWKRQYQISLKRAVVIDGHGDEINKCSELEILTVVGQHSQKSEVIYLECFFLDRPRCVILSFNLMKQELEFLTYQTEVDYSQVCQTGIDLWPTRIPNYERLQGKVTTSTK